MPKILWTLMDDRRGSVSQAKGIVSLLDKSLFEVIEKKIDYTKWAGLPNWIRGRSLLGLTKQSQMQIKAPFPDFVISISRRTVPVARYIKKLSPKTKLIQLMHPGYTGLADFDLVIVPEHDKNKKHSANIHYVIGCTHQVTPSYLQAARQHWQAEFASLPKPLTAVIVGGAIKGKPFSAENAAALGEAVKNLKQKIGGSVLLTTSRRTGRVPEKIIAEALKDIPQYTFLWGDTRENPYSGFLACADNLVVTGDSVSMCCEATATGKPIYLFCGENWLTPKHMRFIDSICARGCAVLLDDENAAAFQPTSSLNAAQEVADLIAKL